MERRTIIILIILGVVVGGYFLLSSIFSSSNEPGISPDGVIQTGGDENISANPYATPSAEAKATFPIGSKFIISSGQGSIETNNFFDQAEGYYPEMESLLITRNQQFQLVFYRATGEFSLTIQPYISAENITEVQENVMNILGVGKTDFCKLKINYLQEFDGGDLADLGTLPLCSSVLK